MNSALVTGCSSGFGVLIAKSLATHGHRVYASMRGLNGRNAGAAQELRDWAAAQRVQLEAIELDVTLDDSVQQAMGRVLESEGSLDILVNNAGAAAFGPLEAFTVDQMAQLLSVNVLGPMRVSKAALPSMRRQRHGLIIWITSTLGRVLPGRGGLYPATKWAAEGFAESLHHQVAPFGIDVVILEPGSFPTPATFKSMEAEELAIVADYTAAAELDKTPVAPRAAAPPGYVRPDPQQVADAVLRLVELPAGQRPLREVVGPVFTDGVAEYNERYEHLRTRMEQVLRRPDQAITWTRTSARPT